MSKPALSELAGHLSGRRSRAWDVTDRATRLDREGQDIIHLGVGDPDFDTPEVVVDAAVAALRSGRTHYSPIAGEPRLRETIAHISSEKYGMEIDAGQVSVFPGAQCALFAATMCVSGPGDEVMLLEPFYATYEGVARAGGASVVSVPLSPDDGFDLDVGRIADALTDRTKVIIANSPGNPSGAVFGESAWSSLTKLCRDRGIWLVSDEVYGEMVFDRAHRSPLSEPGAQDHVVVANSVSKSHAMTGWRLGWTVAPAELAHTLNNLAQSLLFGVSQFTQDAADVALRKSNGAVADMRESFRGRRDAFCERLARIDGIRLLKPAGGMFVLMDVSLLGCDGEQFANALLDRTGVAVVPGFAFGDSVKQFVRIGYLLDKERLGEAADRIARFVAEWSFSQP